MTPYTFPVTNRKSHLAKKRIGIVAEPAVPTFEETFCIIWDGGAYGYSKFHIVLSYMLHHMRDRYS